MPRPPTANLPACPDAKHKGSRIRRHGTYGQRVKGPKPHVHSRPRFRCMPLPGQPGKSHTFSNGRVLPLDGDCERCERAFTFRDGPRSPQRFMHVIPDIARGLFMVGQGATYTHASTRTREITGVIRWDKTRWNWPDDGGRDWGLVADWVELFAHAAAGPDLITAWPAKGAVLVDEINFANGPQQYNPVTHQPSHKNVIWSILVAMCPMGMKHELRVARMRAVPKKGKVTDYIALFSSIPGRPTFVVSDDADLIKTAAHAVWPGIERRLAFDKLELTLRDRIFPGARIRGSSIDENLGYWKFRKNLVLPSGHKPLPSVFRDPNEWASWVALCRMSSHIGVQTDVVPWIDRHEKQIEAQFALMPYYPCEASPVEAVNVTLSNWFETRSFSFRNTARTNLLLELMTAELSGKASTRAYQRRIAAEIDTGLRLPRHLVYHTGNLH